MKIKPLYIYSGLIIVLVVVIIMFSQNSGKKATADAPADIQNKTMPNDDVHKGMGEGHGGMGPSGMNVSKEIKEKLASLKQAADKLPEDTAAIFEYAQFLASAHKPKESLPYFQKILKQNPKRTDVLFSLTLVYYNLQDFSSAEEYTNKILSIDKNNLEARFNLGAIYATRGENDKAGKVWGDLAKKNPDTESGRNAKAALEKINQK